MQGVIVTATIILVLLVNDPLFKELSLLLRLEGKVGLITTQYFGKLHVVGLFALLCGKFPKDSKLLYGFLLIHTIQVLEIACDDLTEYLGFK